MPAQPDSVAGNRLLDALPERERRHVLRRCERIELRIAEVLCRPGERIRHVYFPLDSFISLITPLQGKAELEVGLVGCEGMLGASLVLGVPAAALRGLVQGGGAAWRMDAKAFAASVQRRGPLQQIVHRYLYVTLAQLAQTAACTRFHHVEARLARWLLVTRDRAGADVFPITHQFLAAMLGVRRAGVSRAADSLRRRKLISYSRGRLTIVDGPGLEAASCGCYAADRRTYRRILG